MRIEIIDFYPIECDEEKQFLSGLLKVNLLDIGLHILGVFISKKKQFWHVSMPGRSGVHHETGESVRYPFISFEDRETQKELVHAIREQGSSFIEKRMADKENPLIFPEKYLKLQNNQKNRNKSKVEEPNNKAIAITKT